MICPNCGKENIDNSNICTNCGYELNLSNFNETNTSDFQSMNNNIQSNNNLNNNTINNQESLNETVTNNNDQSAYGNLNNDLSSRKNKANIIIAFIIILIVIVCIIIAFVKYKPNKQNKSTTVLNTSKTNDVIVTNDIPSNKKDRGVDDFSLESFYEEDYNKDDNFLMQVEDVFNFSDGAVVTGKVKRGTIKLNDEVQVLGLDHEIVTTKVISIEMFRREQEYAIAGDDVGIKLKNVASTDIERGQVIALPDTIKTSKKFEADVYILTKEEGGDNKSLFNGNTNFYFRTTDITGTIINPKTANLGDVINMTAELKKSVAMEVGTKFYIREKGKTIARGIVTKVY